MEGLPPYAWPGGSIQGTLVLETDKPFRVADVDLALHGRELSQATVHEGKSSRTIVQQYPFLEVAYSFKEGLSFQDPEHIAPGTYQFPFRFDLPPDATPSLSTSEVAAVRGRFFSRPDGMYVEYELEARVRVPWWVDPVDRVVVPVYSTRRVLGTIPPLPSPASDEHPSFRFDADPTQILPGGTVTGSYSVSNPKGKRLGNLSLQLYRHVEYSVEGRGERRDGPSFTWAVALEGREPAYTGRFEVAIPNTADTTGPFHGQLHRTWWMAHGELDVEFGFNAKVDGSFTPA